MPATHRHLRTGEWVQMGTVSPGTGSSLTEIGVTVEAGAKIWKMYIIQQTAGTMSSGTAGFTYKVIEKSPGTRVLSTTSASLDVTSAVETRVTSIGLAANSDPNVSAASDIGKVLQLSAVKSGAGTISSGGTVYYCIIWQL